MELILLSGYSETIFFFIFSKRQKDKTPFLEKSPISSQEYIRKVSKKENRTAKLL